MLQMSSAVAQPALAFENIQITAGIEYENGADLRDAQHERDGRQQAGMRNTTHPQAEADESGLHERSHDDAQRHTLHGLPGEDHGRIRRGRLRAGARKQ